MRRAPAVAAAVAGCGFVAGVFPVFETDLFWHLAAGRWILEHGTVPRTDPFRFTADGVPWVDHEWLFQVAARAVEAAGGLDALVLLRAAALALFALAMLACGRRAGLTPGLAGLLALGATLGVRPRFLVRPEIATLFGVVLLLRLLEEIAAGRPGAGLEARSPRAARTVLGLVALVAVWVQLHGEAMLAPGLAFLALLGGALALPEPARRARTTWGVVFGVPALLALALLLNPYGWRLFEVPLGIARALADLPAANPEWLSSFAAPQPYLFAGLATVTALAVLVRRRTGRWPAPEWALPTLALAALALSAVRHQALFYAAAAPFAARALAALPETRALSPRAARVLAGAALALAAAAALWCALPPAAGPLRPRHGGLAWGFGLAPGRFPVAAAERLARRPGIGPLYNELAHGGYLLWRLHPPRQVWIDGRMELDPALLHETAAARGSAAAWEALLEGRGAVGALVRYDERPRRIVEPDGAGGFRVVGARTTNALLFEPGRWQLADWDDETMLFMRPGDPSWPEPPYRFVQPEDFGWTLARAAADPAFRAGALDDVERKLAGQPECGRARRLRELLRKAP